MTSKLRSIVIASLAVVFGAIGLAVHDDGGGGGGAYLTRPPDELRQLLQDYRARHEALRRSITTSAQPAFLGQVAALSEEQEMLQLQQLSYEAQVAQLQTNRLVRAR